MYNKTNTRLTQSQRWENKIDHLCEFSGKNRKQVLVMISVIEISKKIDMWQASFELNRMLIFGERVDWVDVVNDDESFTDRAIKEIKKK